MRTLLIAFLITLATQAGAEQAWADGFSKCGKLCESEWWEKATTADFRAELNSVLDVVARDEDGGTPLHWAAGYGKPENIRVLLESGADVMARGNWGITPLHWAAALGTPETIQALLEAGADVMARDEDGKTLLHYAAMRNTNRPEYILVLLEAGADAKATDADGKTPWDLAEDNKSLKGTKGYWALNDARFKQLEYFMALPLSVKRQQDKKKKFEKELVKFLKQVPAQFLRDELQQD